MEEGVVAVEVPVEVEGRSQMTDVIYRKAVEEDILAGDTITQIEAIMEEEVEEEGWEGEATVDKIGHMALQLTRQIMFMLVETPRMEKIE